MELRQRRHGVKNGRYWNVLSQASGGCRAWERSCGALGHSAPVGMFCSSLWGGDGLIPIGVDRRAMNRFHRVPVRLDLHRAGFQVRKSNATAEAPRKTPRINAGGVISANLDFCHLCVSWHEHDFQTNRAPPYIR